MTHPADRSTGLPGTTSSHDTVNLRELTNLPNLLSISRVLLTPVIAWLLALDTDAATYICLGLLILAGITDFLDGFAARRIGYNGKLGKILDPIADKIMAGVLIILLILHRDFPIWLAAIIVGRDLLILIAGMLLLGNRRVVVPSNLTGKYAFASIAVLLACYVVQFDFGITMMTGISLALITLSMLLYTRTFITVRSGGEPHRFVDRPATSTGRILLTLLVSAYFLYHFYFFITSR